MSSLDIKLKKVTKIYHEGGILAGVVVIKSSGDIHHQGINLTVDGTVSLQLSSKSVGVFEALYNSTKPLTVLSYNVDIAKPGQLPSGTTEIPFEVPLKAKGNKQLYETYHGVFVNIQYMMKCMMKRSIMYRDLEAQTEFIMEKKDRKSSVDLPRKAVNFKVSPDSLQNSKEKEVLPDFLISGRIDTTICDISKPFTGELVVDRSASPIRSLEVQLVRVETCGCAEGYSRDVTEIQNIQLADGDVCRGIMLPIYMVFPRLFTCPTLQTNNFKVEFEVNIVVIFQNNRLVSENFPIELVRCE